MKAIFKPFILSLILSISLIFNAQAQENFWEKIGGPSASYLTTIVQSETGAILAGSPGGIFRSTDLGMTWQKVDTDLGTIDVWALASAPEGRIYAGSIQGLLMSEDGGEQWEQVDVGGQFTQVGDIEVDAAGAIYLATGEGVFYSDDNGASWASGGAGLEDVLVLYLDSDSQGTLYAGTVEHGVYRSLDGENWEAVNNGLSYPYMRSLLVDSEDTVWAGTGGEGVFFSTDMGMTWQQAGSGPLEIDLRALMEVDGAIFAGASSGEDEGANGGIFRFDPSSSDWSRLDVAENQTEVRSLLSLDSGELIAGTAGQRILRSTDEGETWDAYESGLNNSLVSGLYVTQEGDLFSTTMRVGFYTSADGGESWRSVNVGDNTERIESFGEAPNGNLIVATNMRTIYLSNDGGVMWNKVATEADYDRFDFYHTSGVKVTSAGTILIPGYDGKILRSENDGEMWTPIQLPLNRSPGFGSSANTQEIVEREDGSLYTVVYTYGVFRSFDDGITWEAVDTGLAHLSESILHQTSEGELIIGSGTRGETPGALYRSVDSGDTWELFYEFPLLPEHPERRLSRVTSIAETGKGDFYVTAFYGVSGGEWLRKGFYYEADSEEWSEAPFVSDLLNQYVIGANGYLYAATFGEGIFRSKETVSDSPKATSTDEIDVPDQFVLNQNYPNPFNPVTTISFTLPSSTDVTLTVFDILGREVQVLHQGTLPAGGHSLEFDAAGLPSGMYLYRLDTPEERLTNTMLLMK